jgi:rod shape determining protein RodA
LGGLKIDWLLFFSAIAIACFGLVTMSSFSSSDIYFEKQIIGYAFRFRFFFFELFRLWFFKETQSCCHNIFICSLSLGVLYVLGHTAKGAQSWFNFGGISFQPSDLAKLALIIILAKYFSKRHVEIANIRHILVSGIYAFIIFSLILFQPHSEMPQSFSLFGSE